MHSHTQPVPNSPPNNDDQIIIKKERITYFKGIVEKWIDEANKNQNVTITKMPGSSTSWIMEYVIPKNKKKEMFTLTISSDAGERFVDSITFKATKEELKDKIESFLTMLAEAYKTTYDFKQGKKLVLSLADGPLYENGNKIFQELIENKFKNSNFVWQEKPQNQNNFLPNHNSKPEEKKMVKEDVNITPNPDPTPAPAPK